MQVKVTLQQPSACTCRGNESFKHNRMPPIPSAQTASGERCSFECDVNVLSIVWREERSVTFVVSVRIPTHGESCMSWPRC